MAVGPAGFVVVRGVCDGEVEDAGAYTEPCRGRGLVAWALPLLPSGLTEVDDDVAGHGDGVVAGGS